MVTSLEERLGAAESGAAASLAELGKKAQDGVAEAQESARVTREKAATEVRNAQQELRKQLLAAKEGQKLAQAAESKLREQQTQLEATTSEHGDLKRKHETIAKRLIASDKERKLYMEAVRMLKLRLSDAEAKSRESEAKRGLYEKEIERLSEWVMEYTTATARVTESVKALPEEVVMKWLGQIEKYRDKCNIWYARVRSRACNHAHS